MIKKKIMSTFPSPASIFNGSTNWSTTETIVKNMVSYINSLGEGCCTSKAVQSVLNQVNPILTAMRYDSPTELNNPTRWQADIEASYRLIWPLT